MRDNQAIAQSQVNVSTKQGVYMEIITYLDFPLHLLLGTVIGLGALVVVIHGFKLPSDFIERQKTRSELKRKVMEIEQMIPTETKREPQSS